MKKILKNYFYFFIYLFIFGTFFQECFTLDNIWDKERKENAKEIVRDMFYHAYNNYMNFAFPHDELKPLSSSWTDSFVELGTLQSNRQINHNDNKTYNGIALTLIDSLSTLAILRNKEEFSKGVNWLSENLSFDVDARVNVFEADIRVLGGLLSAHLLSVDPNLNLIEDYDDQLLLLAKDLGARLLNAFLQSPTGLPYAWVNLKYGVLENEITEQCTAGITTLLFEFEILSYLTQDLRFKEAVSSAIKILWELRNKETGLIGNTIDNISLEWINANSGIGSGIDSFYEVLFKTYIMFGNIDYLRIFVKAYVSVLTYLKTGPWYAEADMKTGSTTYFQFNSLQSFWPGLQVLIGDIELAQDTHRAFYSLWERYKLLPERFLIPLNIIHPTERYYPLRPELIESTYFLYRATKDPFYLDVGFEILSSINNITRVPSGFASVKDVETFELEDHMCSFFLAETCKYLYLLFDEDNFVHQGNYMFSTEGHIFPVFPTFNQTKSKITREVLKLMTCPLVRELKKYSKCHIEDKYPNHRCIQNTECGVDHNCVKRKCSQHFYCFTPSIN